MFPKHNAAAAAANMALPGARPALEAILARESDPVLLETAAWALERLE